MDKTGGILISVGVEPGDVERYRVAEGVSPEAAIERANVLAKNPDSIVHWKIAIDLPRTPDVLARCSFLNQDAVKIQVVQDRDSDLAKVLKYWELAQKYVGRRSIGPRIRPLRERLVNALVWFFVEPGASYDRSLSPLR